VRTDRTDCECGARIILALGVPPLDWDPDPAGTFAARHAASGAWHARPWNPGDVLAPLEKRRRVHRCETP
jgi:hypothetical protein